MFDAANSSSKWSLQRSAYSTNKIQIKNYVPGAFIAHSIKHTHCGGSSEVLVVRLPSFHLTQLVCFLNTSLLLVIKNISYYPTLFLSLSVFGLYFINLFRFLPFCSLFSFFRSLLTYFPIFLPSSLFRSLFTYSFICFNYVINYLFNYFLFCPCLQK